MKFVRAILCLCVLLLIGEGLDLAWLGHVRATVSSSATSVTLSGNGSTTVFNFPFIGVTAGDVTVIYTDASGNETTLASGTQYSISLNAPSQGAIWGIGGTVTYPLTGSPIASGTTLTISRNVPYLQTVSSNQGQAFPTAVEAGLDLLSMQIQQVTTLLGHNIATPPNDSCNPLGYLPAAAARANQMLGFDATGCNPIAGQPSSALVSSAMQPVVAASSIAAANALLGINTNFNTPVGAEIDWPGLTAPSFWHLEDGSHLSRTTYSTLFAAIAPVVPCTITSGSSTITGISSTVGWGTGWIIESPGSSAIATGQMIATVAGSSVTISGGNATANATSCQLFPYGTAQDGTFNLPNGAGVVYAGIDTGNTYLTATYCTGNPAYLNAVCGAQSGTLARTNLPNVSFTVSGITLTNGAVTATSNIGVGTGSDAPQIGALMVQNTPAATNVNLTTNAPGANLQIGTNVSVNSQGSAASGGSGTAFPTLPPLRIRNKIIFMGHS